MEQVTRLQANPLRGDDGSVGEQRPNLVVVVVPGDLPEGQCGQKLLIEQGDGRQVVQMNAFGCGAEAPGGEVLVEQREEVVSPHEVAVLRSYVRVVAEVGDATSRSVDEVALAGRMRRVVEQVVDDRSGPQDFPQLLG